MYPILFADDIKCPFVFGPCKQFFFIYDVSLILYYIRCFWYTLCVDSCLRCAYVRPPWD